MFISLATLATQFLERPGLAKTTIRSYESALLPLLEKYGAWSIELLTRSELIEYLNGLSHLAYTTHHKHQAIVQALFNFAVEQDYISVNPIVHLKRRKPDSEKGEHDRHSQCSALFTAENPLTKAVSGWGYRSVYQHWRDLIQPYPELKNIRIHDLRHTFATERVGVMSLEELRALMGHQNIQTTLHYQEVTSQKAEAAAQRAFTALLR